MLCVTADLIPEFASPVSPLLGSRDAGEAMQHGASNEDDNDNADDHAGDRNAGKGAVGSHSAAGTLQDVCLDGGLPRRE